MLNQGQQFSTEIVRQGFDVAQVEAFAAEGPVEFEFAAIHLTVHRQPVGQRRIGRLRSTAGFASRGEQRVLGKALVELAEVIESHSRLGQCGQSRLRHRIAQVA
ncbi:hypothetical protein D9M71_687610 [compost metagenome]